MFSTALPPTAIQAFPSPPSPFEVRAWLDGARNLLAFLAPAETSGDNALARALWLSLPSTDQQPVFQAFEHLRKTGTYSEYR